MRKKFLKINNFYNRFFDSLAKHNIVSQVTILFCIVILIPSVIIGGAFLISLRQSTIQQADRNNQQYLQQMKRSVEENMSKAENLASQIMFGQEIQYFLKNDPPILDQTKINYAIYRLQGSLLNARYTYPNLFYQAIIYTPNETVKEVTGLIYNDKKIKLNSYYRKMLENKAQHVWGEIRPPNKWDNISQIQVRSPSNEHWVLPYYVKILTPYTNECVGVLEIDILIERLVDYSLLFDSKTQMLFQLWGNDKQLYFSSKNLEYEKRMQLDFATESGARNIWINGTKQHVLHERVPNANLHLVGMIPLSTLTHQSNVVAAITIATLALAIAFVVFLGRSLAKNLFKRLTKMDLAISSLENGEFSLKMDTQGEDEISRIARSFNKMADKLNAMIQEVVTKETARKDAEMRALQAQINPHFLYNTLENMRMQCEIEGYFDISDALFALAELLRYTIDQTGVPVSMGEELAALENYMTVMRMRFSSNIHLINTITQDIKSYDIPKMTLQPIVENSINHGFSSKQKDFYIIISAHVEGEDLYVEIKDDGKGILPQRLEEIKNQLLQGKEIVSQNSPKYSIGLSNVDKRLRMQYQNGSGLSVFSNENGTCIQMLMKGAKKRGKACD